MPLVENRDGSPRRVSDNRHYWLGLTLGIRRRMVAASG
eukprot:CAMPEP_0177293194 /NCGR_PEP_ID=MMETSP0368-20130122/610_1 /TAXON_ID=447022 ORGANISM="Scrippsiella hangoei-like, Strain SHHI-4" /NCGR_SAMPLE_ID=MMETSP0368 /ASSEMBLY_ACC=CAM_ASM_000363 /LENGTH=37 /DNA_ID= /DNA_START= /DNA_END= /DNA_ORIENTATION=